jgi:hypothetical protein
MPPPSDPPRLTADELRLLARLEGRPLPRGPALQALLGERTPSALRLVRKLRREGVLAFAAASRSPPGGCVCISFLQIDWSRGSMDALEDGFRRDPDILSADRLLGPVDYRLFSGHADHRAAAAWIRTLREDPAVARMTTRFCASIHDRPHYAAARLSADQAEARLACPSS